MSKLAPTPLHLNLPAVVFIQLICCLYPFNGSAQAPDGERAILLTLKQQWQNPPSLAHWTASGGASHCDWPEIDCTAASITALKLSNLSISAPIPPLIAQLRNLRFVDLSDNRIPGEFPTALCACSNLTHLDLSGNPLAGPLPDDVRRLSELQSLNLTQTNFSGNLPAGVGRLQNLSLTGTLFDGAFPAEIGNWSDLRLLEISNVRSAPSTIPSALTQLKKLYHIFAAGSNLIGEIPAAIGEMVALKYLDLSNNGLTGGIPATIGDTAAMEVLDLSNNRLTGSIPAGVFLLKNLTLLYLENNSLSGEIPPAIQCRNLVDIDLGKNDLTGPIPEEFGNLKHLAYLSAFMNRLSGRIPASIGRLPNLTFIKLFSNNLSGPVPSDLGLYSQLQTFEVADNRLSGGLPPFICSAGGLLGVVAFHNNLTGELPPSLAKCNSLLVVMIHGNIFSGTIPAGLWLASDLMTMLISDNLFTGELPEKVGMNLSRISISNNKFYGQIPARFPSQKNLAVFEASNNLLVGSIPRETTALPRLESLLLDGNKLSGQLPSEIISWESLTALSLARNEFSGSIPAEIGSLPRLGYLDLSDNQFSGQIPATLARPSLLQLNLSSNDLSGRIPLKLENLAYQSSFVGNPALCSSNPSLHLEPCHPKNSRRSFSRFVAAALGVAAAVFTLAFLFSVFAIRALHRSRRGPDLKWKLTSFQRLDFTEADIVSSLTENNVIGGGGFGTVYRAAVGHAGDEFVAVKRVRRDPSLDGKLEKQFAAEVRILSTIRHSNIVRLLCCVHSDDSKLLVYEYLKNRSLDVWLHGGGVQAFDGPAAGAVVAKGGEMDWPRRLSVAVGAAQGLCYMHHHCLPPIIHGDVKSSNILLDGEFNAKIADFGLARMLQPPEESGFASAVQGSFGYMAPEYAQSARVDEKIDVYSFGVVLLELVTGREARDGGGGEHGCLVDWARGHIQGGGAISEALDREIKEGWYLEEMGSVFKLGLLCTREAPATRPSMSEALRVLLQCRQGRGFEGRITRNEYEGAPLLKSSPDKDGHFESMA